MPHKKTPQALPRPKRLALTVVRLLGGEDMITGYPIGVSLSDMADLDGDATHQELPCDPPYRCSIYARLTPTRRSETVFWMLSGCSCLTRPSWLTTVLAFQAPREKGAESSLAGS